MTLQNQVASPKGKPAAFSQMPPSPPYRAPCTWQTCTMAQLPQLHARCTNPLQQCFPPQLPISHGSVFRQAAVFSQPPHPGGSSQDQGGEECTLELVADWRRGSTVHHQLLPQGWGWWMQLLLPGLRRNCNSDAPSFNSVSHKTSFSKKYMFEHIEDIGPAVRPTLIISFGQMNRGEIAAGWDW